MSPSSTSSSDPARPRARPAGRWRKAAQWALVAAFVGALWTPLPVTWLRRDRPNVGLEKRYLAPLPHLYPAWVSLKAFPGAFQAYFNDHFGLRAELIRAYSLLLVKGLGTSSEPQVLIGKNGWLFLGAERLLQDFRGALPNDGTQVQAWREAFAASAAALARQGIRFLVVIVPDKQSVYPEFVPAALGTAAPRTRVDQVLESLRGVPNLDVLDLRAVLRAAKGLGELYERTDTHWNSLGAAVAARAILERLHSAGTGAGAALPPLPAGPVPTVAGAGGDLAGLLAMKDDWVEERPAWAPAMPAGSGPAPTGLPPSYGSGQRAPEAWVNPSAALGSMVMFHDSFAWALKPYLAGYFRRALFVFGSAVDEQVVARERPRWVIRLIGERALLVHPPAPLPGRRGAPPPHLGPPRAADELELE